MKILKKKISKKQRLYNTRQGHTPPEDNEEIIG
jgi:hypothetical protein